MASTYSCIIVDDESSSRKIMQSFVSKYCPKLEILGEASNIIEAKKLIDQSKPQIVFLDIEMPHGTAFDLLDQYHSIDFHVVFITAYSQYAIQAFNLASAKYLLKPIDIDQLVDAVEDVCKRIDTQEKSAITHVLMDNLKHKQVSKVIIPLVDGFEIVRTSEIIYISANDNFSVFQLVSGKRIMACRKLSFYEDNLANAGFLRIHRSTIINLDKLKKYQKGKGGIAIMENGKELDVSQSRKKTLLNYFKA